ncbi:L-aminoadipate-semialdehyde dehydrogenase-phosphopantetheinyl transferase-like isoform X1 [Carex littledalei]|uniref:holo-[acyl-carrier-protein] synthase n=1 Tax=Carex littledalei TaxID=544730 RepID=A0A833QJM8_9POAL|nr:L-aminoadipate-semialdehyde dehydrogenase-phosphopantetheinyl transferase-like isoform X1 [Carex littledalei]
MEGVRRWLVDISGWNPSEHRFQSLLSLLPPQQQPQVTRFVKLEDRKRALVSRLLQYSLVTDVLGIPFDKISILHTTEGKPYLKNKEKLLYPNFNYSVSHHGDYVGVACEPICLVGFDIVSITKPQMETTLQYLNNFMPYFTPFEWDNIVHAGPSNNTLTEFYRYWCLKEAYVKAIGAGLGFGLNRLEFHHNNWTDIYLCIDGIRSDNWRFFIFELENNHLACVAKGHPKEAIESYQVTLTMDSFDEEEYLHAVEFPEPGFISLVVDQLVIQS